MLFGNDLLNNSALNDSTPAKLSADQLISIFNDLFADSVNTRLEGGGEEPIYLPADDTCDYHRLIFRSDYISSALHEISHWCIAGKQRRQVVDFGYWYNPDGRTAAQQRTFEQVEVKPQAMEWIFSVAANHPFNISADNLSADIGASEDFINLVVQQAEGWCTSPMPARAAAFTRALAESFGAQPFSTHHYRKSLV
jgi:elongation factor P hydroxylase|tara:strand:- start:5439 stop:6026 length:588 start_codon:yes stop_codon:yes gene_type:complete